MLDFPAAATFGEFVEKRASDRPDKTYVKLIRRDAPSESLTYAALESQTAVVAQGFVAAGASPGDRVLMLVPNSLELVVAMLAAARAGLISVPINTSTVAPELQHIVALVEPAVIVIGSEQADTLLRAQISSGAVNLVVMVGGEPAALPFAREVVPWRQIAGHQGSIALTPPKSSDLFQLLMTSGTTGRPKAVMLSHATRLRSAYRGVFHARMRDDDVLLNPFPAFHINCLDSTLLPALVSGATAVMFDRFSASNFWRTVREERATVVCIMPTVIRALLARPPLEEDRHHCVRLVCGALRPTRAELDEFFERFAITRYENGYGLTEAGMAVTQTNADQESHYPSIGAPMFDRTIDLVDDRGDSVAVGEPGEIVIRSIPASGVMDGYWRDPAATANALVDGWLHTGDLARRDEDGYFYFVGRVKDVIKRSGENIGAEEVESVLVEHPAISEVAVIGVPDSYRDEAVMAFVVPRTVEQGVTLASINEFCDGRLASFKVPTVIRVVDDLPRGMLGKVDKKALRVLAAGLLVEGANEGGQDVQTHQ
jgi:carnitine-CoA ligase